MNKSVEIVMGNELQQLSENGLPAVHRRSSRGMIRPYLRKKRLFSNRLKPFSLVTLLLAWTFPVFENP